MRRRTVLAATLIACALASGWPGRTAALAQDLPRAHASLAPGVTTATVPFEPYRRWMLVDVSVAGSEPLRFIVDTGAPITVLADAVLAHRLGLTIVGQVQIGGAGEGEASTVLLASGVSMRIGDVTIEGAPMAVGLGSDAIAGADGIIGAALLDDLVVEIDWQSQELHLSPPETWAPPEGVVPLPLRRIGSGHLVTTAGVSIGDAAEREVRLVVDTGAGHPLSLEDGIEGLPAPPRLLRDVVIGWGSNGVLNGNIGRVDRLRLGDWELEDVVTTFPNSAPWRRMGESQGELIEGNLGAQVLQRFSVALDIGRGHLYLSPNDSYSEPFRFDQAGMALLPWPPGASAVQIADVIEGSPAQEAGVLVGDEITAVGERPVSEISSEELMGILEGRGGDRVRLTFRRGPDVYQAALALRPLI